MELLWIISLPIIASLYMLVSKKIKYVSILALTLASIIALYFFMDSLSTSSPYALYYGMMVFFLAIGLLVIWSSLTMVNYDIEEKTFPLYYFFLLILISSLCAIIYFDNLLGVYVALEISAFLSAALVMIKPSRINFRAGINYLLLSILASAFFLIGIVILYRLTGTMNIGELRDSLSLNNDLKHIRYGFIFIFIGIAFKSALFPFHIWLPGAYGSAPAPSSAILSGIVSKSYILLFIKLIYIGFGIDMAIEINILPLILVLGVCGMLYGSFLAILQEDLQHRIAYSSVAQIGYIFLGIGLGTPLGLVASIFHIIAHGITKACLFLIAGRIINTTGVKKIKDLNGIGKALPITMALYTICSFSMIGIPLFAGFLSKWNFAYAAVSADNISIILVLTLSSLLNGIYYLPIAIRAFFAMDESDRPKILLEPKGQLPVIILGGLIIVTGIFGSPLIDLLTTIVQRLI